MCGISCILALHGQAPQTEQLTNGHTPSSERKQLSKELDESLDQIKHRGPDARGQWISEDNRVGTLVAF